METGQLGLCSMAACGLPAGDCGMGSGWELFPWEQWGCLMAIDRNQGRAVEGRQHSCELPRSCWEESPDFWFCIVGS